MKHALLFLLQMSQARCTRRFFDACARALEPKFMSLLSSSFDDAAFTAKGLADGHQRLYVLNP